MHKTLFPKPTLSHLILAFNYFSVVSSVNVSRASLIDVYKALINNNSLLLQAQIFHNVQKYISERITVDILQLRLKPSGNMGHGSAQWSCEAIDRPRGELYSPGNCKHKCCHHLHLLPEKKPSSRNKTTFSRDDCEKSEKVFFFRNNNPRRQKYAKAIQDLKLPVNDENQAVLH